jgi:hypothetical protein
MKIMDLGNDNIFGGEKLKKNENIVYYGEFK